MRSKKEITRLLRENRLDELTGVIPDNRKLITLLISSTYDKESVVAWRAIEAIGLLAGEISATDPEFVRNLVRRLLWMIRDESGGIGWSVPEILGEIVRNAPVLCADIAPIITSFHEEEMLTSGVMRAIGRIGKINAESIDYAVPVIISYLNAPDRTLRGNAAWAFGEIEASRELEELEKLRSDNSPIRFYEEGELKDMTVGEIAAKALEKLSRNGLVKEAC